MELFDSVVKDIRIVTGTFDSQIPLTLHEPDFKETKAKEFIFDCINSGWVSSQGKWVDEFENKICQITKAHHAVAVTNGTDGLRLALHVCGVKPDEEVILPSLTFVATANCIAHLGAIPHFMDIETDSFGLCPNKLDQYLKEKLFIKEGLAYNKYTNKVVRALIPVHLFGIPARIHEIVNVARKWNLRVVEDAAEALGSFSNKEHCGLIGDVGVISFNGNKIITCGGGGILITNSKDLAKKAKHLSTTAKTYSEYELIHDQIAWNDRLPNINAALGCSQLENFSSIMSRKRKLAHLYHKTFADQYPFNFIKENIKDCSNYWLNTIKIDRKRIGESDNFRKKLIQKCKLSKIFIRPVWKPLHTLNMFKNCPRSDMRNTLDSYELLINFPSSPSYVRS